MRAVRPYTLLEMLLVVTIMALAAVAVAAAAASGLRVYQRAREYSELHVDLLLGLERCERDLRNVFPYEEIGFSGSPQELSFPGLVRVRGEAGTVTQVPGRIFYAIDAVEHTFTYRQQEYAAATAKEGGTPGEATVLAHDVAQLAFHYFAYDTDTKQYYWTDHWDRAAGLPQAVRLDLTPALADNSVTWTRTILLPSAYVEKP